MVIQQAHPEQAEHLKQVAVEAKGSWGYEAAWMLRRRSPITLTPEYIRANDVYVAIEDSALGTGGEIIGFYALTRQGDVCELDHLWVVAERIGTGVGHALFAHALQLARAAGARLMVW